VKFGHVVTSKDQGRIACQVDDCEKPATVCLYGDRVGYYYHCDEHTRIILNGADK
jgi:hypothetical protein